MRGLPHNYQFSTLRFRQTGNRLFRANSLSRYKDLEILEYDGDQTVESWYPMEFSEQSTDQIFQITALEKRRPDLLCSSIYRNTDLLWWVIVTQARMLDPFVETVPGLTVRTPSGTRVLTGIVG